MQAALLCAKSDTETDRRVDKRPVLSHFIPKVLGFSTPLFKHQKYFMH